MIAAQALRPLVVLALAGLVAVVAQPIPAPAQGCAYWVAPPPEGRDSNAGTFALPWATLDHAAAQVQALGGSGCTVWFKDGLYQGASDLHERFTAPTSFRALNPYRAILENDGQVIELSGARNLVFEGFEIRHAGPGASKLLVYLSRAGELWTEQIVFRNNIFHDSYNDDLLKIHNGVRFVTVEGNLFYNQGPAEEHIDVNGVNDIAIQDNLFFNDFAGSGRRDGTDAHSFITIKDSTGNPDGLGGSRRIIVRRNIFLNWQGRRDTFVQVGNDGKPYYEAVAVRIENNLMLGNAPAAVYALLGVRGAAEVTFANNTVVGDLPSAAYALWAAVKDLNPPNRQLLLANNIWSDPSGTMGADGGPNEFANGDPAATSDLLLDNNLYWNGGAPIPPGELISPLTDDLHRLVGDPLLNPDQRTILLPRWGGAAFPSGNTSVRQEFVRLVECYGAIPARSPAVDAADPAHAPADDILGRPRGGPPDLGAFEYQPPGAATATPRPTPIPTSAPRRPLHMPFIVTR